MSARKQEFIKDDDEIDEDEEESTNASDDDGDDDVADTDNVGDASVEINVEELISELEHEGLLPTVSRECTAKKRLEDLMEQRRSKRDLEDFDDYDL